MFTRCVRRHASTLILGEFDAKGVISGATRSAVSAGKKVGGPIHMLLAGVGAKAAAASGAQLAGVEKVFYSEEASACNGMAEGLASLLKACQDKNKYSHIIGSATNYGRNVLPRLAVSLDVAPISEVTGVIDEHTFERPMYAGNAIAQVRSKDSVKVFTVRSTAFEKVGEGGSGGVEAAPTLTPPPSAATFTSQQEVKSERPELTAASVVVAGGRALKSAENFKIIYDLADKMGAAVGASRAAVDAGYVPNDMQVGQTGKCVAPTLYVAVGISGAIQHMAGMKDSKVIVAVNKDPDAPIHQVADYGLVEDLFKAVPEMTSKVSKK